MNFKIQNRDIFTLIRLYSLAVVLRDHLHVLCFDEAALRRFMRRMARLGKMGLVVGEPLPLGAFPMGLSTIIPHPGQFAYRLGEKAIPLVAEALGIPTTQVRRRLKAAPSNIGHAVCVGSIAVAIHKFSKTHDYQTGEFLCEMDARYRYQWKPSGQDWQTEELRPDALVMFQHAQGTYPVHWEADRATQGRAALEAKLDGYALYARTGALQQRFPGASLHLCIVTTTPERLRVIERLLANLNAPELSGVLLTTFQQLTEEGPLAPIWRSHTHSSLKGLL